MPPSCPRSARWLVSRALLLALALDVLGITRAAPAAAQAAPVVTEPPLMQLAPPSAVPAEAAPPASAPNAAELTRQLLELERETQALELKRAGIKTLGYRIGKIACWSVGAVMLFSAFGWYGTAQSVEKALKDGRDDEAYDVNGNDKVTKHDEDVARIVARTLAITSLIPIGLGVFTTLVETRREREKRMLTHSIDDLADKRRGLLRRLDAQLSASHTHASLQLHVSF